MTGLKQFSLAFIGSFLLGPNFPAQPNNVPMSNYSAEAYRVYSAVLPEGWPWHGAMARRLVIRRETEAFPMCLYPEGEWEGVLGPAIRDYNRRNKKIWLLKRGFQVEKPYEVISAEELKSLFTSDLKKPTSLSDVAKYWDRFYERFPESGGWIELSAVGFNHGKTVAVVYMGHHCGSLCGGGAFFVLQKRNERWELLKWRGESCIWAS